LDDIYKKKEFDTSEDQTIENIGTITEKEKLIAAKQILFGIAILYVITLLIFLFHPEQGNKLLDICTSIFPPLVTLILVSYFREQSN
jgi:hypothetical protein